ncbi:hypothetical protein E2R51_16415 [Jeotgalibacillus sp. S-D1]|uniref:hypothetical protein n=1 Tax=Jeotgalibacillus sp. S-D1 TaxID=2552189 RepID=UPI001059E23B|nr:hypothetical protein [Jeotgalibacillus sp. S-D1]TDL30909.1 hypothetical protein E2R51_16415 [Jeotgalibacillus sp. S-D1]
MIDYTYFQTQLEKDYTSQETIAVDQPVIKCITIASAQLIHQLRECKYCSDYESRKIQRAVNAIEKEILSKTSSSRVLAHMLARTQKMIDAVRKTPEILLAYARWKSLVDVSIKSSLK